MKKFAAGLLLGLLSAASVLAQNAKDNPKCEANPVFNRFAGEVMASCERARFKALELWRFKTANNPKRTRQPKHPLFRKGTREFIFSRTRSSPPSAAM